MSVLDRFRNVLANEQLALERATQAIEVRDPSAATQRTNPYATFNKKMIPEWNADTAIRLAYYANVFVYRCIFQCATAIGGLPFRAGKNPEKPDIYSPNAPLALKLGPAPGGPAPRISARRLWAWTVTQYIVTGKFGWEIECAQPGGKGEIVNFWPLVSAALNAYPTTGGNDFFSGYSYGKPDVKKPVDLNTDQVFYVWRPAAHDYRQPESPLQAARLPISVAVMQDRYDYAFLSNDARPAALVVHEAFAVKAEEEAWKRQFKADFRGPDNAGKILFVQAENDGQGGGVTNAVDVKTLGLSQEDAKFIERHTQMINDICVGLGTPLSILGDSSKRTYDNANVEHRNWWEGTLQPLCSEIADEVNMQIAPRMGNESGWFDFSQVKALQSDSRLLALGATLPALVGPGKPFTYGELREEVGLSSERPPDAPGDIATTPTPPVFPALAGAGPRAALPPAPPSEIPAKPAPPAGAVPLVGAGRATAQIETRAIRTRQIREIEYREIDRKISNLEQVFEQAMKKIFARQERAVMSRLTSRRGRRVETRANPDAGAFFDKAFWDQELAQDIEDQYSNIVASATDTVAGKFEVNYVDEKGNIHFFTVSDPKARDYIAERANLLAGNVNNTTYEDIKDVLAAGVKEGKGIPDLSDDVQKVFDTASETRAATIARTEVISAYNGATSLLANVLPDSVVAGKEWISTLDNRTRGTDPKDQFDHVNVDGEQAASGENFTGTGEDLDYPGDPNGSPGNIINCRCTIGLLTPDEFGPEVRSQEIEIDATDPEPEHQGSGVEALRDMALWR